jgi:hypothetical protein
MIIENGQLTMVASGSMASLATIESPDEAAVIVCVQRSSSSGSQKGTNNNAWNWLQRA